MPDKSETRHIINEDYDDPPKIAIQADEGTHALYLAFSHDQDEQGKETAKYVIKTDLDKLINGLLGPASLSPFDVVLVAQSDGVVIFQRSLSGIEAARIKTLEDASGGGKEKTDKQTDKQAESGLLPQVSRLEEVRIAGARYRFYSQPLQIGFRPADPTRSGKEISSAKSGGDSSGPWILCGLVRADRFQSESQLIPYAYILLLLTLILLAAAAYPFLRLYLSSPGERLRARDVTTTAVFACLVTAVLTVTLADAYYWGNYFGQTAERDMRTLASAIDMNFARERSAAFAQLGAINARSDLTADVGTVAAELAESSAQKVTVSYGQNHEVKCKPEAACKSKILEEPYPPSIQADRPIIEAYPYLFFVFWQIPRATSWSNGQPGIDLLRSSLSTIPWCRIFRPSEGPLRTLSVPDRPPFRALPRSILPPQGKTQRSSGKLS